jgi:hypothetical protein
MDVGEILNAAFNLYRDNAGLFLGTLAVLLIPQAILDFISPFFSGLSFFTSTFSLAALILVISARYLGQPITIGGAYSAVGVGTWVILLVTNFLAAIMIGIGLILIIIPGIFLLVKFAFIDPVIMLERKGITEAFSRSWDLVRGSWWRVFGIGILVFILTVIAEGLLTAVLGAALTQRGASVVGVLVGLVVQPFTMSALVLLYYDLRLRKEGAIGSAAASGYAGGPLTS